jgi:iron complex outermembrane receptor protein
VGGYEIMNNMKALAPILMVTTALTYLVSGTSASFAQDRAARTMDGAGQPADDSGVPMLEEIIVTSQKRAENLQDVPIAVSAMTGQTLDDRNITNISQISGFVPNLVFKNTASLSGASNASVVFIRGLGQTDFAVTTDPGVGTYLDGVYISRSVSGVLDSLDIERVEVLRGPQGTLFGRNTIGGAVSVTSRRPGDELAGEARLTIGKFNRMDFAGAVDLPISETLRARASFIGKTRDGNVRRVVTGERMGDENSILGRLTLLYDPSDTLDVTIALDKTRIREASAGNQTAFSRPVLPGDIPQAPVDIPGVGTGILPGDPRLIPSDPDISYGTGPNQTDLDIWGVSSIVESALSFADFKSISAYRKTSGEFGRDGDATPFPTGHQDRDVSFWQFSQEFQLVGTSFDDKLQWASGLYYFKEKTKDKVLITLGQVLPLPGIAVDNATNNDAYAAFGQATFHLTDVFSVTGGLRYTYETKRYTTSQVIVAFPFELIGTPFARKSFDDWTPRLGFEWTPSDDLLFYASASRGFKSGGFTARYGAPVPAPVGYGPETIQTFEMGAKWTGVDGRLRLNGALFHSDYKNIQVVLFDTSGAPITQNGGAANIDGFELEGDLVVSGWFKISGSMAWLDARYVKGSIPPPPPVFLLGDPLSDTNMLPNAPKWTSSLSPVVTLDVGEAELMGRLDWRYSSKLANDAVNSPELIQGGYQMLDGSVTYSNPDRSWSLTAGVSNITDKRIIISGGIGRGPNFGDRNFNRPREWYMSLRANF